MQGTFLNKKQIKKILEQLGTQWGFTESLGYAFFINNRKRIFLVTKEAAELTTLRLRINSFGLYFCELMDNDEIRLTIEGSQIVGPSATKNVIHTDSQQAKRWMYGEDLEATLGTETVFVILKHNDYFLGCGRYKNGIVSNHVSKNRRIGTIL